MSEKKQIPGKRWALYLLERVVQKENWSVRAGGQCFFQKGEQETGNTAGEGLRNYTQEISKHLGRVKKGNKGTQKGLVGEGT